MVKDIPKHIYFFIDIVGERTTNKIHFFETIPTFPLSLSFFLYPSIHPSIKTSWEVSDRKKGK